MKYVLYHYPQKKFLSVFTGISNPNHKSIDSIYDLPVKNYSSFFGKTELKALQPIKKNLEDIISNFSNYQNIRNNPIHQIRLSEYLIFLKNVYVVHIDMKNQSIQKYKKILEFKLIENKYCECIELLPYEDQIKFNSFKLIHLIEELE